MEEGLDVRDVGGDSRGVGIQSEGDRADERGGVRSLAWMEGGGEGAS